MTILPVSKNQWFLAKVEYKGRPPVFYSQFHNGCPMVTNHPLVEPVHSGLFHSLAGKGRAGGREGKVNDAEVGGT